VSAAQIDSAVEILAGLLSSYKESA